MRSSAVLHSGTLAVALGASLAGCGLGGALHQATLVGQCATDDVACSRRHPQAPIAIGTRFYPEASTELAGTTTPNLRIDSAAPDVVAVEDGALVARQPGTSAVLISTDDGSVVDFVQVWAAPVTQITLARRDGDRIAGPIALAVGEDITLVPALWNSAQRLSGARRRHLDRERGRSRLDPARWLGRSPPAACPRARHHDDHRPDR